MRFLISQVSSLVTALVFAAIIWAVAISEQNPSREAFFPELVPVEIRNQPDGLVTSQKTADAVRLKIRAPQVSWDQLRLSSLHASVDLKSLNAGLHLVPVNIQVADPRAKVVEVEPPSIELSLEPAKSRAFEVTSEVLDAPSLGYSAKPPFVNQSQATVTGPTSLVDQVAEVAADISLRGAKAPIEREVTLVAHDIKGNVIKGVTISPATVLVQVPVEPQVGYKDVSIKAVLKGTVASGYWISNIVVTPSTTTIVGSAEATAKIPGFIETLPIDVNAATSDVTTRATLSLPEGVSALDNEPVAVQVSVTPIFGGQTIRRKVVLQGLRTGLIASVSPDSVEVILSGPLPRLQNLTAEDVLVAVDVASLGPGVYPLKPRVVAALDSLKVQNIVPDTVQVSIIDPTATPPR